MANELRHMATADSKNLYSTDWADADIHRFNSQATGDILYASSPTQLARLGVGSNNDVLRLTSGIPAWTSEIATLINDNKILALLGLRK